MNRDIIVQILERSGGGLDIIQDCLPDAIPRKAFKLRNERTASAFLKEIGGKWVVTDFGDEAKAKDCFTVYGEFHGLDFKTTLKQLCFRYGIETDTHTIKPKIETLTSDSIETKDGFAFQKMNFTDFHLKTLGKIITSKLCQSFGLSALKWYVLEKEDGTLIKISSTPHYPIYLFEYETFQKVYQPLNSNKGYRFFYKGKKPIDFIFGLERVKEAYSKLNENKKEDENPDKLEYIILCSGERDALNIASYGYQTIALNSETQTLDGSLFKTIMSYTKTLYNVPDLDPTGFKQGKKLALTFWDIKTVWLPDWLTKRKDFRGNPCKDATDFCKYATEKQIKKCIESALSLNCFMHHEGKINISTLNLLELVSSLGYYKLEDSLEKTGFKTIKVEQNIYKTVNHYEIRDAVLAYLDQRGVSSMYKNLILNTTKLNAPFLERIKKIEIIPTISEKKSTYFNFFGKRWRITATGIKEELSDESAHLLPRDQLIDYTIEQEIGLTLNPKDIHVQSPPFNITYHDDTYFDIDILKTDNDFLNFLINTSRLYWQDEPQNKLEAFIIDSKNLAQQKIDEQKHHLINKIYAFGYLLHTYKNASTPWAVFAMDGAVVDETESHGGTGKSIYTNAFRYLRNLIVKPARDNKLFENNHLYEGVTEHTNIILFDDANRYFKFDHIFTATTGDLVINPKNKKSYTIPFRKAPKFSVSTNYSLEQNDPSTLRRLLITVFSDYYHFDSETYMGRTVFDDFGYELFKDWNEKKWNDFINFSAYALAFFLSQREKINPPMQNVKKRTALHEMGQVFFEFCEGNLLPRLNTYMPISEIHEQVCNYHHALRNLTKKTLNAKIKAWCTFKGFIYNPKELCDKQGYIIKRMNDYATPVRCVFIKSLIE